MSFEDQFSLLSPESPNLLEATVGVFGDSSNPIAFSGGSNSALPSGDINPEDFAAFPKEMFDEGLLRYGQTATLLNPATKKKVVVIARHAKSDNGTGLDVAPHTLLELGFSPNKKYILDLNPVKGYPVAEYPAPQPSPTQEGASQLPDEMPPSGDLSQVSMEGGSPQGLSIAPPSAGGSNAAPDGIKSRNSDGSITYNDGITIYPDGHYEHPVAGGQKTAVWTPGSKKPTYVNNNLNKDEDTDETIAQAIISGAQPPDLKGLYRHGAGIRKYLQKNGYDLSKANLDWQAVQKHIASLEGPQQLRMRQAIDNAFHSLDVIEELSNQWDGGGFPLLNKVRLLLAKQGALGPEAQKIATQLEAQINDVTSELGNVYMGGNSPTDHSLKLAQTNLSSSWSKDQLKANLDLMRKNLIIRDNSIKNTGVSLSGNRYAPDAPLESKPEPSATPGKSPAAAASPAELEAAARRILIENPNDEAAKALLKKLGK